MRFPNLRISENFLNFEKNILNFSKSRKMNILLEFWQKIAQIFTISAKIVKFITFNLVGKTSKHLKLFIESICICVFSEISILYPHLIKTLFYLAHSIVKNIRIIQIFIFKGYILNVENDKRIFNIQIIINKLLSKICNF